MTAQVPKEPKVPTLCLAATQDLLVPAKVVESFAHLVRQAGRDVVVETLEGEHIQTLTRDEATFTTAITQHIILPFIVFM